MKRHDKTVEDIDKLEDVFAKNNHRYVYSSYSYNFTTVESS